MEDTAQQQVFRINEIALCIFGYVLGDDANEIKSKLGDDDNDIENLPCVSSSFRTCFLYYLRSTPLKFAWREWHDHVRWTTPRNLDTVRWMKRNDVTIHHLKVDLQLHGRRLHGRGLLFIDAFIDAFKPFDLSTLLSLDISIRGRDHSYDLVKVRELYSLFSKVTSLAHLSIRDETWRCSQFFGEAWSCHQKLKLLKVELENFSYFMQHAQSLTELERLACEGSCHENISFASQTLIALDLSGCYSDISIDSLTCPSLEEFVCEDDDDNNVTIGGKCGSDLMKEFGNSNRDFITTFAVTYRHLMCFNNPYHDESGIACVAIVPAHIISSDMIQVPSKCRFILVNFEYEMFGLSDENDY